ncbi:acyl carrier protein [Plantactinospora sp. GCM10030261]|uniref:acyl carrier protein n=1 Tax=Plantactinospora sp. GCM10030261 TaxID=3273420 RepID=UPI0036184F3F
MWQVVDLGGTEQRLRERAEINDVAAVRSPDGRLYVLLERQGLVYGPWARDLVLDEIDEDHANVCVVVVGTVPRCASTGALDHTMCITLSERAAENPAWVFSLDPPVTAAEKMLSELITELLPIQRLSMTDSLPMVGADSLVLAELSAALTARFGVSVDAMRLFETDTVRELAVVVFGDRTNERDDVTG